MAGFDGPELFPGGLHCGMLYTDMEQPDAIFDDVAQGDIQNLCKRYIEGRG